MNKTIVILVAQVKYPSSNNAYLSANSYITQKGSVQDLEKAEKDFREHVEVDGFKIINFLAYIVPNEQIEKALI